MRLSRTATLLLLCAGLHLGGCGRSRQPDVVLITVDTLRPDALGWVAGKNATPAIDALAGEGFAFPAAVAPVPLTLPSHASILTGLVPRRHGVRDNGQILDRSLPILAERLSEAGYRTGAFISGYPLRRMFGLDRGFDTYQDELASRPDGRWQDRPAGTTTSLALEWLRGVKKKDPDQPYFLWIHYYDPHAPYEPPARFARSGPRGAYDGEVAAVDNAVAALRRGLEEAFPSRDRLLILTADHGEGLGEHDEATHGFFIYDSTTLVPLVFHGLEIPHGSSPAAARLIDVAPTILELLGLSPLPETDGESLAAMLQGKPLDIAPALVESIQPFSGYGWAPLTAWRTAEAKWIEAPKPELYDLAKDAGELENLAGKDPRGDTLRRALAAELKKPKLAKAGESDDPEVAAALRSLGYAGGSGTSSHDEPPAGLPDPKDRQRQKKLLDLAEDTLAAGDTVEALAVFDVVLAGEPENRYALLRSGQTLVRLGQLTEAIPLLEKLLALDPDQTEARFELADALGRSGKVDDAIAQWMALLQLQPRRAIAWSNLGILLLRRGELEKAESALAKAFEIESDNPVLRSNLAECRYQQALAHLAKNDPRAAQAKLRSAVETLPELRQRAAADLRLASLLDAPATPSAKPGK